MNAGREVSVKIGDLELRPFTQLRPASVADDASHEGGVAMLQKLIPKIFYEHLDEGFDFFVDGLGFQVLHQDLSLIHI